mmetsp:Transcript_37073/g.85614  ORF Transcript_37073/g.85614 Transcript_37073/m.85614 type:complete len:216 (+) Transcript_37073:323-970(+)
MISFRGTRLQRCLAIVYPSRLHKGLEFQKVFNGVMEAELGCTIYGCETSWRRKVDCSEHFFSFRARLWKESEQLTHFRCRPCRNATHGRQTNRGVLVYQLWSHLQNPFCHGETPVHESPKDHRESLSILPVQAVKSCPDEKVLHSFTVLWQPLLDRLPVILVLFKTSEYGTCCSKQQLPPEHVGTRAGHSAIEERVKEDHQNWTNCITIARYLLD